VSSVRAVSRAEGLRWTTDPSMLCVDTFKDAPDSMARWRTLCPFHAFAEPVLPVPGQPGMAARSVEGVWQGLKIVDGRTDLEQLTTSTPVKRPPDQLRGPDFPYAASQFVFADRKIDLVTARWLIYLPVFVALLRDSVPAEVHEEIWSAIDSGREVLFYDWDDNFDIEDHRSSFSHSSVLHRWYTKSMGSLAAIYSQIAAEYGADPILQI
jgi:uncharacterized protein DUF6939